MLNLKFVKKTVSVLCLGLVFSFSGSCDAKHMTVTVTGDTANKSHWTESLAKFADQVSKLREQIDNQKDMINKKALDLMSYKNDDLSGAGSEFQDMLGSIESIHKNIDAIGNDYTKTLKQWDDLMPDYSNWKDMSVEEMAKQTAKTDKAWEKALQQGLLVSGSNAQVERRKNQDAVNKAVQLSANSKGSVQSLQALSQLVALNSAAIQRLETQLAEANRMRAVSDMRKLDEERKAKHFNEQLISKESGSLNNVGTQTVQLEEKSKLNFK